MTTQVELDDFYTSITPNADFKNEWKLVGVKEFKMRNGIAWTGKLVYGDLIAGQVECKGDGGCYYYSFESKNFEIVFHKAVKEAYANRELWDVEEDCFVNYLDWMGQTK